MKLIKSGILALVMLCLPLAVSAATTIRPINVGTSKILVLLYDFKDSPVDGGGRAVRQFTEQQVTDTMFGTGAVNTFFKEQSYNQINLTGTVLPWKRLARNARVANVCTYPTQEEIQASIDTNRIDIRAYDRIAVVAQQGFTDARQDCFQTSAVPHTTQMLFNNGSYLMAVAFAPRVVGDPYALEHELGHTFQIGAGIAMQHGSVLECPAGIVSSWSCSVVDASDHFDLISAPSNPLFALHTNAFYKDLFGWFAPGALLNITQSGVYSISPIELPVARSSTGVIAAKITLPGQTRPAYYIEYRQPIGIDARLTNPSLIGGTTATSYPVDGRDPRGNLDGIFVYQDKGTSYPLLDMSPTYGSNVSYAQKAIDLDQVALTATHAGLKQYYDPNTGVTIGPITAVSPTQISFRVQFNSGQSLPVPPDVVVGSPDTITETTFSHDGASASDANGDLASYRWSITCGTACPTITTNASGALSGYYAPIPSPTIVAANGGGTFTLNLTVVDATQRATTQSLSQTLPGEPPLIYSITPTSAVVGSADMSLTVNGSNFTTLSAVNVNGVARPTTFVSPTTLTAVIPAADLISMGSLSITVTAPSPGGRTSNAQTLTVTPAFDFSLAVSPLLTITSGVYGARDNVTLTGSLISGTPQPVTLSTSGFPSGVSGTFDSRSCTPNCTRNLYVSAVAGTPTGTYPITVTGTSGTATRAANFSLTINAPKPLSVPTTVTIAPASTTNSGNRTQQYTATIFDQVGSTMAATPLTWSSSIPATVTVSPTGLASVLNKGATTVIADVSARTPNGVTSNVAKLTVYSAYDYNNDHKLDPTDLNQLRQCVLSSAKCIAGKIYDLTGDSKVDVKDVVELKRLIVVSGPYDYNSDMKLTSLDINILSQVIFAPSSCPAAKVCDVNGDGRVTAADVSALTSYITSLGVDSDHPWGSQIAGVAGAFEDVANISNEWHYTWNNDLQIGSPYTADVMALQRALTEEGLFVGDTTGGFYDQTFTAVELFQEKYGIKATGYVGALTREKLNELYR